ncbi:hypothetical protein P872_10855 [Rhodonellum psychrophilum GCM71 = DSM 17998]|uniref:Uncharacterized protein n=1 Tax=Rhodonellum psychrophilum GCM71 = DSM 17998 TaxID=1123057 RepID=U5BWG0_9BACT|nr:hypothetical protein P872_10855 [Rhodonellum psychrophilum GCM71 = DSM 17998]
MNLIIDDEDLLLQSRKGYFIRLLNGGDNI